MTTQELRQLTRSSTRLHAPRPTAPAAILVARQLRHRGAPRQSSQSSQARQPLQIALRAGDAIAIFVGFAVPLLIVASYGPQSPRQAIVEAAVLVAVGLWSMRLHGLWTAQVITVRSIEMSRLFRAVVTLSAIALVIDRKASTNLRVHQPRLRRKCCPGRAGVVALRPSRLPQRRAAARSLHDASGGRRHGPSRQRPQPTLPRPPGARYAGDDGDRRATRSGGLRDGSTLEGDLRPGQ